MKIINALLSTGERLKILPSQTRIKLNTLQVGSNSNNVTIDENGELVLNGTSTLYDDSMIPANSFRTGGTALALNAFMGGIYLLQYDVGDIIYVQIQLPHAMKLDTVIYPHLHLACNAAIGATNYNVEVNMTYSWANFSTPFPVVTTVNGLRASFQNNAQYTHRLLSLGSITPTANGGGISSYVIFKIERVTAGAQAISPATSIFILGMDAHYEIDSLGSKGETSK